MEIRQIIAWAIIGFIVVMIVAGIWYAATAEKRQRVREKREFDRRRAALVEREDS